MSESKIELNERKIRNGIRKEQETRKKQMWNKLSGTYTTKFTFGDMRMEVTKQAVTTPPRKLKAGWAYICDEHDA